ncbi:TPA_asm: hypothetical protein [Girado virus 1]|nr:TPA_asm: hypothetical protein [Girado virus 1]
MYIKNNIWRILNDKNHYRLTDSMTILQQRLTLKFYLKNILKSYQSKFFNTLFQLVIKIKKMQNEKYKFLIELMDYLPHIIDDEGKTIIEAKKQRNVSITGCNSNVKDYIAENLNNNYCKNYYKFLTILNLYKETYINEKVFCSKNKMVDLNQRYPKLLMILNTQYLIDFFVSICIVIVDDKEIYQNNLNDHIKFLIVNDDIIGENTINHYKNYLSSEELLNKLESQVTTRDIKEMTVRRCLILKKTHNITGLKELILFCKDFIVVSINHLIDVDIPHDTVWFNDTYFACIYPAGYRGLLLEKYIPYPNLKNDNLKCKCLMSSDSMQSACIALHKIVARNEFSYLHIVFNMIKKYNSSIVDFRRLTVFDLTLLSDQLQIQWNRTTVGLLDILDSDASLQDFYDDDFRVYFWVIGVLMLGNRYYNPYNTHCYGEEFLNIEILNRGLINGSIGLSVTPGCEKGRWGLANWKYLRDTVGDFSLLSMDLPILSLSCDSLMLVKYGK